MRSSGWKRRASTSEEQRREEERAHHSTSEDVAFTRCSSPSLPRGSSDPACSKPRVGMHAPSRPPLAGDGQKSAISEASSSALIAPAYLPHYLPQGHRPRPSVTRSSITMTASHRILPVNCGLRCRSTIVLSSPASLQQGTTKTLLTLSASHRCVSWAVSCGRPCFHRA